MTQLQQQLKQVFPNLPDPIKALLLSEDFNDRIAAVTAHYGLDESDTGIIIRLVVRLLSGIMPANELVTAVADNVELDREQATLLAQEINRDIFNPVKDALTQMRAGTSANGVVSPYPTPMAPVAPVAPQAQVVTKVMTPTPQMPLPPTKEPVAFPAIKALSMPIPPPPTTRAVATPPIIVPQAPIIPPTKPALVIPQRPVQPIASETKAAPNNLESKLGKAFVIKKDILLTQESVAQVTTPVSTPVPPTPPLAATVPVAPVTPVTPVGVAPVVPQAPKVGDPYRELPS